MAKVSVHLVTWNGKRFLEHTLASLFSQTYKDFEVLVIDNASSDGTAEWIKREYPDIKVIQNPRNKGFSHAHNQAIHFTNSDYVLLLNQDIILTESYLADTVAALEAHTELGSVSGILLRVMGRPDQLSRSSFTTIVDSAGLNIYKSRRVTDAGAGQEFSEYVKTLPQQGKGLVEVFGVSGALPLYRRQALEDVKLPPLRGEQGGEYFDEDFHSYKEDADIAWRLQLYGWTSATVTSTKAYHFRSAAGDEDQNNIATLRNRLGKSAVSKTSSLRNHLWMIVKNDQWSTILLHAPFILWYEIRKWGIVVLFEQKSLQALWHFFAGLSRMKKKRAYIHERIKVSKKEIRTWFI